MGGHGGGANLNLELVPARFFLISELPPALLFQFPEAGGRVPIGGASRSETIYATTCHICVSVSTPFHGGMGLPLRLRPLAMM